MKKLQLHRETLRHLDDDDLARVDGGRRLTRGCAPTQFPGTIGPVPFTTTQPPQVSGAGEGCPTFMSHCCTILCE